MGRQARDLPWRRRRTPWRALVSEFMLQQTQVSRVVERFEGFLREFPSAKAMAAGPESAVVRAWSGMGYYRRARNLHKLSVALVERHGGRVPRGLADLAALPGVGRYTAGALASIVFGERAAIVDGNVARVLLRVHGEPMALESPATQRWLWERAQEYVDGARDPSVANEGLMELGALVCTPRGPRCGECPLESRCKARLEGCAESLPVKARRVKRREWRGDAIVCMRGSRLLVTQRAAGELWEGMWLVPLLEGAPRAGGARGGGARWGGARGRAPMLRFDTSGCRLHIRVRCDGPGKARESAAAAAKRLGVAGRAKWVDVRRAPEVRVGVVARVLEVARGAGTLP